MDTEIFVPKWRDGYSRRLPVCARLSSREEIVLGSDLPPLPSPPSVGGIQVRDTGLGFYWNNQTITFWKAELSEAFFKVTFKLGEKWKRHSVGSTRKRGEDPFIFAELRWVQLENRSLAFLWRCILGGGSHSQGNWLGSEGRGYNIQGERVDFQSLHWLWNDIFCLKVGSLFHETDI